MRAIPRIVIAAPASGAGKTTCVIALAEAFRARGLAVAAFKCGPDYLDPTYHARATGHPSHNLDDWLMGSDAVRETFAREAQGADLALVEGVMGLHDGPDPEHEGATAQIARWLRAPVLLVVDAAGMARTFAAVCRGLAAFDPAVEVVGALANRAGSPGHLALLAGACRGHVPFLGGFLDEPELAFPERHLGLVTASAAAVPDGRLRAWGVRAAERCDLDAILEAARAAPPLELPARAAEVPPPLRCRIALARDDAFHFYYPGDLRRLEALGAVLVPFSPVADDDLPGDVDGVYLGGGYPETRAGALSAAGRTRGALQAFAARGGPVYAECGGLMYLAQAIQTLDGRRHAMVGLVPGTAVMADRLQALGYVEVETARPTPLGEAGLRFRGHQFRYSTLQGAAEEGLAYRVRRRGRGAAAAEGYGSGNVLASYVHAHWASNPLAAAGLVDACARFRAAEGRA